LHQAVDQTSTDRIARIDDYDRNGSCALGRERRGVAVGDYHIDFAGDQFFDQVRQAIKVPLRSATLEYDVAALGLAELREPPDEGGSGRGIIRHRRRSAE
jgi:hypothetical protein